MDKNKLASLRDELLKYRTQFRDNYDHGSNGPYGSNEQKRVESKLKYKNAIEGCKICGLEIL